MAQATYLDAIRQAMIEEMDRDPAVLLMGEDVGVYGGAFKASAGLLERFGWERVIDTPISETAIVGAAVGMSYLGLRPIAEMQFIDFIACAFNQITNFVAKSHYRWGAPVPIVIRMEGTNVDVGKRLLSESGMNFSTADRMDEAAARVVQLAGSGSNQ